MIASAAKLNRLLTRAEHVALVSGLCALVYMHANQVAWGRFACAFLGIDLVGYLPGALRFRLAGRGRISATYFVLYNIAHSYLTAALVTALWAIAAGHVEWAMLALPIHLSGDRGLFGNAYKSTKDLFDGGLRAPGMGLPLSRTFRGRS